MFSAGIHEINKLLIQKDPIPSKDILAPATPEVATLTQKNQQCAETKDVLKNHLAYLSYVRSKGAKRCAKN